MRLRRGNAQGFALRSPRRKAGGCAKVERMNGKAGLPSYDEMLWPTVMALRELGGSGSISEIDQAVADNEGYTDEQQAVLHGDGPSTEIGYRLHWARTYLKGMGLATNSQRGVWTLTEAGRQATEGQIEPLRQKYLKDYRESRKKEKKPKVDPERADDDTDDWREVLLDTLLAMPPDAFERLCNRLLREAGFSSLTVTGKTGDGGIDGVGVYRMSLVSFPVFFQAKRWKGSVRSREVRDFRGAMQGRGDKGLLITTGSFTADAEREATRDGAPPVDLIDGQTLCDLLAEHRIGVKREQVITYRYEVDPSVFQDM